MTGEGTLSCQKLGRLVDCHKASTNFLFVVARGHRHMAVAVETIHIDIHDARFAFPVISMMDRRKAKTQRKQWALVRATEQVLYGVGTSRSTGQFSAHLQKCSMESFVVGRAAVEDGTIKDYELDAGIC